MNHPASCTKNTGLKRLPSLFFYLAKAAINFQVTPYNGYIQSDSYEQLLVSRIAQQRFSYCGVLNAIRTYVRTTARKAAKISIRPLTCILRRRISLDAERGVLEWRTAPPRRRQLGGALHGRIPPRMRIQQLQAGQRNTFIYLSRRSKLIVEGRPLAVAL